MKTLFTLILVICLTTCFAQDKLTFELNGFEMTYKYSGGNSYNVKFEKGNLSYRFLSGSKPEIWWGPFPYKATKTENDEYFLSWYEERFGDFVTLLLNPSEKSIWGSALIIKGEKSIFHFEKADISEFKK